ncbi:MAG: ATP-binding cassette domain-containing protein, partial [Firmicutes bacterium]|nr:ATP-binding cassette domain-containing protein [Bacillota bacterium]
MQLRQVSRTYQRGQETVQALDHVSLSFYSAEVTLILGPSGGGKSTLLHLLGGMDRPDTGEIWEGGQRIDQLSPHQLAAWRRTHIGFIFQDFYLLPQENALDNVSLPLWLSGDPVSLRHARSTALL